MDTQKCIWMDAGVVEYQLCPLKQNCDLCDFHKEMIRGCRTSTHEPSKTKLTLRSPEASVAQFLPGLQYLQGHFWYKRVAAGRVRIGIDAFLWQLFSFTHKVIIPRSGGDLIKDQCFGWLILDGGIIYLKTPISGKITAVNPYFEAENIPGPQHSSTPENELWFLEIAEDDPLGKVSLNKEQYFTQIQQDCRDFKELNLTEHQADTPAPPRISQFDKHNFTKYLKSISNNRAFIC